MLTTLLCMNGKCLEAIDFYKKALNGEVQEIILNPKNKALVDHAEICIHGSLLMMNDFGGYDGISKSSGYLLSLSFRNKDEMKAAYDVMKTGSTVISPMSRRDYTPCEVLFIDKYDVRWGFWVK
jgi:PhnB protein